MLVSSNFKQETSLLPGVVPTCQNSKISSSVSSLYIHFTSSLKVLSPKHLSNPFPSWYSKCRTLLCFEWSFNGPLPTYHCLRALTVILLRVLENIQSSVNTKNVTTNNSVLLTQGYSKLGYFIFTDINGNVNMTTARRTGAQGNP